MTAYVEPPKVAAKLSFYNEVHSTKLANLPAPTPEQVEAAKNVVFREPDADTLGLMIFGEPV